MMQCPRCGHENLEGELFCASCQQRLPRPPAAVLDAMYADQDARRKARRRQDLRYGLVWGLAIGIAVLALALWMEATGGDPGLIALGKQLFWLIGIFWGLGIWGLRRMASSER